ncbi:hypothetical protein BCR33DRAFT_771827 [Rhizoclosmatium globosum]|uniref:Uncharacterized protein n=1 Tax=Rhizoclosmatium globosum TaxID=329046 RepID=A0A1Y2B9R1_9FUNG|nr:hypothetical protein BCR33DRAFT_771827 [Rhizoclosmatium globosum]|eukprot:ORY31578.1 hypothetical protein BCR33DRAFT_771827 [Rhizoclosmatium globosum]
MSIYGSRNEANSAKETLKNKLFAEARKRFEVLPCGDLDPNNAVWACSNLNLPGGKRMQFLRMYHIDGRGMPYNAKTNGLIYIPSANQDGIYRTLRVGYRAPGHRTPGQVTQDTGHRTPGQDTRTGHRTQDTGHRTPGQATQDTGHRTPGQDTRTGYTGHQDRTQDTRTGYTGHRTQDTRTGHQDRLHRTPGQDTGHRTQDTRTGYTGHRTQDTRTGYTGHQDRTPGQVTQDTRTGHRTQDTGYMVNRINEDTEQQTTIDYLSLTTTQLLNHYFNAALLVASHAEYKCNGEDHVRDNVFDSPESVKDAVADAVKKAGLVEAVDLAAHVAPDGSQLVTMDKMSLWKQGMNAFDAAIRKPQSAKWSGLQMAQYFMQLFQPKSRNPLLEEMCKVGSILNSQFLVAQRLRDATSPEPLGNNYRTSARGFLRPRHSNSHSRGSGYRRQTDRDDRDDYCRHEDDYDHRRRDEREDSYRRNDREEFGNRRAGRAGNGRR